MPAKVFQNEEIGEWYFNLTGDNGEVVAQSEGYTTEAGAKRGLDTAIKIALEVATQAFSPDDGETAYKPLDPLGSSE